MQTEEFKDLLVSTPIDAFIKLVMEEQEVDLPYASKKLNIPLEKLEEWATILEQEGIVEIKYGLYKIIVKWRKAREEEIKRLKEEIEENKEKVEEETKIIKERLSKEKEELSIMFEKTEEKIKSLHEDVKKLKEFLQQIKVSTDVDKEFETVKNSIEETRLTL